MKSKLRSVMSSKYGPVESENDRVGTVDAETPEAKADAHGATALKRKRGGKVEGDKPRMRLDRRANGGKVKGKGTRINIIVAPGAGGPPMGAGMPPGGAPMPPPQVIRPAPPPMAPPGAPPPPGAMPPPMAGPMRADGGRVYPKMSAGAGNGMGREEKIEKYGAKARS